MEKKQKKRESKGRGRGVDRVGSETDMKATGGKMGGEVIFFFLPLQLVLNLQLIGHTLWDS